jgi:hypothetical protein
VAIVIRLPRLAHAHVANDEYFKFDQIHWLGTHQLSQAEKTLAQTNTAI